MAEPWLPHEDRLAVWDPVAEQVRVIGWRPGPAGVSAVELAPGLRAMVDHASPTTLTEVTVDADAGWIPDDVLEVLGHLIGEDAADVVRRLPSLGAPGRPTPIRRGRRTEWDELRWLHDAQAQHRSFAQFALAADLGGDAGLSDLARAAALLGAVAPARMLQLPHVQVLAREGLGLLLRSGPGPGLGAAQADRLDHLVQQAVALAPGAVPHLDVERARLRLRRKPAAGDPGWRRRQAADGARPAAAAFGSAAAPMRIDHAEASVAAAAPRERGRPVELDGDHRGWAWLDHASNVQIRAAAGGWGRVFRRRDRLLLGLAPVRADAGGDGGGSGGTALVVIPPVDDPADVVVDLVTDPAAARRAPAHEALRQAVLAGRRAARLTRLGSSSADPAWQECAALWRALGDVQRANLAERHGRRDDGGRTSAGFRGIGPEAVLADELR